MPIYEYECRTCGTNFEELVRRDTPDEEIACPECGDRDAHRKLSTFATAGTSSGSCGSTSSCGGSSGFG